MGRLRPESLLLTALLSSAGMVSGVREARGQQRVPVSLELSRGVGTESCISEAKLQSRVEERLGRELALPERAEIHISGDIVAATSRKGAPRFRVRLVIRDKDRVIGEREFTEAGASCAPLTERLVLAISLMIDPDSALAPAPAAAPTAADSPPGSVSSGSPSSGSPATPPPVATAESAAPPGAAPRSGKPRAGPSRVGKTRAPSAPVPLSSRPGSSERKPTREKEGSEASRESGSFGIAVSGTARAAILPGIAWGGAVGIFLLPGSLGLEVAGTLLAPRALEQAPHGVDFSYFEASLRLCPRVVSEPRWRWAGCAGVHLGSLGATGAGFDLPAFDRALVGQGSGGFDISGLFLPIGSSGGGWAFVRASALFPFLRPRIFYFDGPREVLLYEAPNVGGELEVGFRLEFP